MPRSNPPDKENQDALRRQYEAFPYPPAEKSADHATGLADESFATGSPSHILEIDHFLYGGRRNWAQPFRALIAGGGTGNAAIMLARQLRDAGRPAEIVYVDLSETSRAIAENRARTHNLTNIQFHTASLLTLTTAEFGTFDYIDCCGVLHHLHNPGDGLQTLARLLAPDGGMGLMFYGEYGRTGIYDLQDIMRRIAPNDDQTSQLPILKSLLAGLPATNRLVRNAAVPHAPDQHDAELVDKFLHPQDRAYTVPGLAALCEQAGLRITAFAPAGRYDPATYLQDDNLRRRCLGMTYLERAALAELIAGNMGRHIFYATPISNVSGAVAELAGPHAAHATPILKQGRGADLADKFKPDTVIKGQFDDFSVFVEPPALAAEILRHIDNETCLEDIYFDIAMEHPGLTWPVFLDQFKDLYMALHGLLNGLFLRYPN
jgi:SAM-dependent methyltransferase